MVIKGKIKEVKENGIAVIEAPIDLDQLIKHKITECYIDYIDSRSLSDKQRRFCYAMIRLIADWSGNSIQSVKDAFKIDFWSERIETLSDKIFSLSNAPMSLVCEFQKFLVNFIIENDVPTDRPLIEYVDDVQSYLYSCLKWKKCCICGRRADLHHLEGSVVGMGNNRDKVEHLGREALSLCRMHHREIHSIGQPAFFERYHIDKGVIIDKTIIKIYDLNTKEK